MAPTRPLALTKVMAQNSRGCFRQTACSGSASIHYNTLKVCKMHSYSDSRKIVKTLIGHHLLLSSVQTVYHETGVINRSNSFTRILYTGVHIILDAQNLPSAMKLQVCNLTSVSFRHHFLVCSRVEHVKLVL